MGITKEVDRTERPERPAVYNNKLAIIGFALMLAGPMILFLARTLQNQIGDFSEFAAHAIMWITLVLPGIGAVISFVSLILKKAGKLGCALSIVTLIMCNPFFYFFYFFICGIMGNTLAGLSWM